MWYLTAILRPDRTVSSFLVGSQELYDFVDDNPGKSLIFKNEIFRNIN